MCNSYDMGQVYAVLGSCDREGPPTSLSTLGQGVGALWPFLRSLRLPQSPTDSPLDVDYSPKGLRSDACRTASMVLMVASSGLVATVSSFKAWRAASRPTR